MSDPFGSLADFVSGGSASPSPPSSPAPTSSPSLDPLGSLEDFVRGREEEQKAEQEKREEEQRRKWREAKAARDAAYQAAGAAPGVNVGPAAPAGMEEPPPDPSVIRAFLHSLGTTAQVLPATLSEASRATGPVISAYGKALEDAAGKAGETLPLLSPFAQGGQLLGQGLQDFGGNLQAHQLPPLEQAYPEVAASPVGSVVARQAGNLAPFLASLAAAGALGGPELGMAYPAMVAEGYGAAQNANPNENPNISLAKSAAGATIAEAGGLPVLERVLAPAAKAATTDTQAVLQLAKNLGGGAAQGAGMDLANMGIDYAATGKKPTAEEWAKIPENMVTFALLQAGGAALADARGVALAKERKAMDGLIERAATGEMPEEVAAHLPEWVQVRIAQRRAELAPKPDTLAAEVPQEVTVSDLLAAPEEAKPAEVATEPAKPGEVPVVSGEGVDNGQVQAEGQDLRAVSGGGEGRGSEGGPAEGGPSGGRRAVPGGRMEDPVSRSSPEGIPIPEPDEPLYRGQHPDDDLTITDDRRGAGLPAIYATGRHGHPLAASYRDAVPNGEGEIAELRGDIKNPFSQSHDYTYDHLASIEPRAAEIALESTKARGGEDAGGDTLVRGNVFLTALVQSAREAGEKAGEGGRRRAVWRASERLKNSGYDSLYNNQAGHHTWAALSDGQLRRATPEEIAAGIEKYGSPEAPKAPVEPKVPAAAPDFPEVEIETPEPTVAQGEAKDVPPAGADAYDFWQKKIDAYEDDLYRQGKEADKLYWPEDAEVMSKAAGWEPMPEELQRLYRERDAVGQGEAEAARDDVLSRLEPVLGDRAEAREIADWLAEVDKPEALRRHHYPEQWRAFGEVAQRLVSHFSQKLGDPPQTAFSIDSVLEGTADNPQMRLRMTHEQGLRPSREAVAQANRVMDAVFPDGHPKIPGGEGSARVREVPRLPEAKEAPHEVEPSPGSPVEPAAAAPAVPTGEREGRAPDLAQGDGGRGEGGGGLVPPPEGEGREVLAEPATMKAREINRELDALEKRSSELTQQLVDAGRGEERWSETAKKDDPLSREAVRVQDRLSALRGEIGERYGPSAPGRLPPGRRFGPRREAAEAPTQKPKPAVEPVVPPEDIHHPILPEPEAGPGVELQAGLKAPKAAVEWVDKATRSVRKVLSPVSLSREARNAARIMRLGLGAKAHELERAAATLAAAKKRIDKMTEPERLTFFHDYETGKSHGDPELDNIALMLRKITEADADALTQSGRLKTYVEHYLPHIYKDSGKTTQEPMTNRPLSGSKAYLKERFYQTLAEAMRWHAYDKDGNYVGAADTAGDALQLAGKGGTATEPKVPLSTNAVDMVLRRHADVQKLLMVDKLVPLWKQAGLLKFVPLMKERPEGWVQIDDPIGKVYQYDENAKGFVHRGNYFMPEDAARIVNNYLSRGLSGEPIFDAVRGVGNALTQLQLSTSLFHATFTSMDTALSSFALGLQKLGSRGERLGGLKDMTWGTATHWLTNPFRGHELVKAYRDENFLAAHPELKKYVDAMIRADGRVNMDAFYRTNAAEKMRLAWREGRKMSAAANAPFALVEGMSKWLMEGLVPRQKLGIFMDQADYIYREAQRKGLDSKTVDTRLQEAWDSVDNRLGQVVYDNVFWHRAVKDLGMGSVRSLGWNMGTWRELGGGVTDVRKIFTEGRMTPRTAYTIALPIVTGLMGGLVHRMMTGKNPEELKDWFFPKTGRKLPNGNDERLSLPGYMKDVAAYYIHFGTTLGHKLNPGPVLLYELIWSNADFYGHDIRDPSSPLNEQAKQVAKYIGTSMVPFSVRNLTEFSKQGAEWPEKVAGFVGLTASPSYITNSATQQRIQDLYQRRFGGGVGTLKQERAKDIKKELGAAIRRGDDTSAISERAVAQGLLTPDQIEKLQRSDKENPFLAMFKHLSETDQQYILGRATKEERKFLMSYLMEGRGPKQAMKNADRYEALTKYLDARGSDRHAER